MFAGPTRRYSRHPSRKHRATLLVSTSVALFVVFAGPTFSQPRPGGGGSGSSVRPAPDTTPITIAEVSARSHSITVGGRLEPQGRIVHRVPTAGYVESIAVSEGSPVTEGQELMRIRRKDDVLELYQPTPLNARISGRVSIIHVTEATEVSSGEDAVTILDTRGYVLKANISDKDAFRIDLGRSVSGRTTEDNEISGILATRSQEPDYSTGLFELVFQFPANPQVRLGEFVLIDLPVDRVEGIFVPREAVVRRYGSYFLWVVTDENTLEAREVQLGDVFGSDVAIIEGLTPGERYLSQRSGNEREGDPIARTSS